MAHTVIYMQGFDRAGNLAEELSATERTTGPGISSNTWNYTSPYGYGQFMVCTGASQYIYPDLGYPPLEARGVGVLFGTNMSSATTRSSIIQFYDPDADTSGFRIELVYNAASRWANIEVLSASTLLTSYPNAIPCGPNQWNWISVIGKPGWTDGRIKVAVNGNVVIEYAGRSVGVSGAVFKRIRVGQIANTGSATQHFFDNLVMTDCLSSDAPFGEVRIVSPSSYSPDSVSWVPNTGTNVSAVSQTTPDGDTTYVLNNTPGNSDLFTASSWPPLGNQVHAVRVSAVARKDDAGTQYLRLLMRTNAQLFESQSFSLGSSYFRFAKIYTLNPSTNAQWQTSELGSNLAFGYKQP